MTRHILKSENDFLEGLFFKLNELKKLNDFFNKFIEPPLSEHCKIVKFEKNCLFVMVENGNWATQLRFQIPRLIKELGETSAFENIKGIICKTRPYYLPKNKAKTRVLKKLTEQSADQVLSVAQNLKDPRLKKILEKIATRRG